MIFDPPIFRPTIRTSLNGRIVGGSGYHPTASARIDAIYGAGGSCPVGPAAAKRLLSDFIRAEEAASRWSLHKRIFLPGFANAAANAIDLVTGSVGTFVNSPTMAVGYVQGNGTNQRFDFGVSPEGAGLIDGSATLWRIIKQAHSTTAYNVPLGCTQTGKRVFRFERSAGNSTFGSGFNITGATDGVGIFIGAEIATNSRFFRVRKTAGVTSIGTNTSTQTGGFASTVNITAMCANNNGLFSSYSDAQMGGYGMSLGMSTANADAFTANLKTLWEGLFNLTLP